jgi:hypothetical protein
LKTNNKGKNRAVEILDEIGFDEITDLTNYDLISGFDIIRTIKKC